MRLHAYAECPECGEPTEIDFNRKRGTVKVHCECPNRTEYIPSYSESVVIG